MLTLADIIRRTRSRLDDVKKPYLWSEQELLDYINDTLKDASIRANLVIQDDIQIPFKQNTDLTWKSKYNLASGVLDVQSIRLASQPTYTLLRTSMRRQEQYYGGRPIQEGTPWAYALDKTQAGTGFDAGIFVRAVTFIGTPLEADAALIDIVRLPEDLEALEDVPEIDEIWHPDLIYGVTSLAYLKRDADTFDPKRSARDDALFEARFGPRLPAVVFRERQMEVPFEMIVG